jgi:phosphate:Na+ symporter
LLLASRKQELKKDFSEEGKNEITAYHIKACKQIKRLEEAFIEKNIDLAAKIIRKENKYLDLESEFKTHHLKRYMAEKGNTVETHEIHMELMDFLRLIIVHSSHIASMMITPIIPK